MMTIFVFHDHMSYSMLQIVIRKPIYCVEDNIQKEQQKNADQTILFFENVR